MTKQNHKAGFGIIGSGFMAHTYAEVIKEYLKNAELAAVSGGSRAPKLAGEYDIKCHSKIEDLLNDPAIHAVLICTPHALHEEQAFQAVKAGRHVMVEKPDGANCRSL